jgi:hypothetical protein
MTVFLDELAVPLEERGRSDRLVLVGASQLGRAILAQRLAGARSAPEHYSTVTPDEQRRSIGNVVNLSVPAKVGSVVPTPQERKAYENE